jgi:murein DD-endopeptidase MepM/ murein hydrolase activator NlpD
MASFAVLLAGNVITGVAFLMSPDIARLFNGQTQRIIASYEDRIVDLRLEVDRLHSRQYAQAGSINLQMQDLFQQQEMLAAQHEYVRTLAQKAADLGIEVARVTSADGAMPASRPAATDLGDLAENLTGMMEDSRQALDALSEAATASTDRITTELRRVGIATDLPPGPVLATGGPYQPPQPETGGFSLLQEANAVATALDRFQIARAALEDAPISRPITDAARLSSLFGNRPDPFVGASAFHAGLDFASARGTEVWTAGAGVVVFANGNGGYGNMIEIEHPDGLRTRYGHLSTILVREGQSVDTGDLIGLVGTTGRSTGPHLHFEVRRNDSPVDPSGFLAVGQRLAAFL